MADTKQIIIEENGEVLAQATVSAPDATTMPERRSPWPQVTFPSAPARR